MKPIYIECDSEQCNDLRAAMAAVSKENLQDLCCALSLFADQPDISKKVVAQMTRMHHEAPELGSQIILACEMGAVAALGVEASKRASMAVYIAMSILAKAATYHANKAMSLGEKDAA